MKTITLCLASLGLFINSCLAHQTDTLLNNIQQKVMNAFTQAKISQSDSTMVSLEQALADLHQKNNNSIVLYWYSYTCYYHSILLMIQKDLKGSEKILKVGIKMLKATNPKTSEQLALSALMESFSILYAPDMEVPSNSGRVTQYAEEALALDSLNLRAYYVLGASDFYTPEQYGGGKKAEGYLKKAVSLPDQSVRNPYLPSWGRNSAYEMLIRLYINHQQYDQAKTYYQQAIALFPGDYMISQLAGELKNH
jgi:tetratricopeptide (TPR) repeat protein